MKKPKVGTTILFEIIFENKKIIITDDSDPENLKMFEKVLKKLGREKK